LVRLKGSVLAQPKQTKTPLNRKDLAGQFQRRFWRS